MAPIIFIYLKNWWIWVFVSQNLRVEFRFCDVIVTSSKSRDWYETWDKTWYYFSNEIMIWIWFCNSDNSCSYTISSCLHCCRCNCCWSICYKLCKRCCDRLCRSELYWNHYYVMIASLLRNRYVMITYTVVAFVTNVSLIALRTRSCESDKSNLNFYF